MSTSAPSTRPARAHVVVVGGGIAGLAAARRLAARPDTEVTLLEAADRLGGKIETERADGFLVEAGPDSFLAAKPRGAGLCAEAGLGDDLLAITPRPHRARVLSRGVMHELPEGLFQSNSSSWREFPFLSTVRRDTAHLDGLAPLPAPRTSVRTYGFPGLKGHMLPNGLLRRQSRSIVLP